METKNVAYILVAVAVFCIIAASIWHSPGNKKALSKVVFIGDKNVSIYVEIADTPKKRSLGLMYRNYLPQDEGMLFLFQRNDVLRFWMKNTLIPLDMIFISENFRIVKIERSAHPCKADPCEIYSSGRPARYVVEVNGGFCEKHDIKEGDYVLIEHIEKN